MKNIFKIFPLFLLTIFGCKAQNFKSSDFIPKGYVEFEKYFGDLNNDGLDDCVLIIKKTDKAKFVNNKVDTNVDRNRRGIIVLFKTEKGYQLADKNYNCFSSENEDGGVYFAPELWIKIKNNNLYIHYAHGRYGNSAYTFRFQNSNFELIGYSQSDHRGPYIVQQISINFLTKKKLIRENTYQPKNEEDIKEVFIEKWNEITIEKLIKLSEIIDFDELDMYNY